MAWNFALLAIPAMVMSDQIPFTNSRVWIRKGLWSIGSRELPLWTNWWESQKSMVLNINALPETWTSYENFGEWMSPGAYNVDWDGIRAISGWSTLQHLEISTTELHPVAPRLSMKLDGAAEFCIKSHDSHEVECYLGNIYSHKHARGHTIDVDPSKTYTVYVASVYDVRVHGDPHDGGSSVPTAPWRLSIDPVPKGIHADIVHIPDFLGDILMGNVVAVDIINESEEDLLVTDVDSTVPVSLWEGPYKIPSGITQRVGVCIEDSGNPSERSFALTIISNSVVVATTQEVRLVQKTQGEFVKATYISSTGTPSFAKVRAPVADDPIESLQFSKATSLPILLGLHGAGVDVDDTFWQENIPQGPYWIVAPSGLTPWGFDWHGPSLIDAFRAREHVAATVGSSRKTLVLGHSNGGQGAMYMATKFPDQVAAAVVHSGYVKIQDYTPYIFSREAHYVDSALLGIQHAALTPFNNDVFMTNIAGTPLLIRHGANDTNVPVLHGRQYAVLASHWSNDSTYDEVPDTNHWHEGMLKMPRIYDFLQTSIVKEKTRPNEFVLRVFDPAEAGSMHGFRIVAVETPGRIASVHVVIREKSLTLATANAAHINIEERVWIEFDDIYLNGFCVKRDDCDEKDHSRQRAMQCGNVGVSVGVTVFAPQQTGPLINVLRSDARLVFIYGTLGDRKETTHWKRLALRTAESLFDYGLLSVEVHADDEIVPERLNGRNIVFFGGPPRNKLAELWKRQSEVEHLSKSQVRIGGEVYAHDTYGLIYLVQGPGGGLCAVLSGGKHRGREIATRMFPVRTGVPIPDYAYVAEGPDGIKASGFWGSNGGYSEKMSYP